MLTEVALGRGPRAEDGLQVVTGRHVRRHDGDRGIGPESHVCRSSDPPEQAARSVRSEHYGGAMTSSDTPWKPPLAGTEAEHLVGALDQLRTTFRWKADDLDTAGLQVRIAASSLTLGGLLKHLAVQEDYAFTTKLSGQPLGPDGRHASLRRLLCDLIEEYGWHTGHADLLREAVDGLVGEDPPPGRRARAGQSPVGS
jgi:Protein of unknown function (DUF664)